MTDSAALANVREAWAAMRMIREAVETLGPVGAVKAAEHVDGPTFAHEAEALVRGIQAMGAARAVNVARIGGIILVGILDDWCNGDYDADTKASAERLSRELARRIVSGLVIRSREEIETERADDNGRTCVEFARALEAIVSSTREAETRAIAEKVLTMPWLIVRDGEPQTAQEAWCQPMDCGRHTPRRFLLYFEDADRGIAVFEDETEARTAFEKANTAWNCYLFGALPLTRPDRGAGTGT